MYRNFVDTSNVVTTTPIYGVEYKDEIPRPKAEIRVMVLGKGQ